MLYTELMENEWNILDEEVINTDWRCDCFLYWRSKEIEKKMKQHKADSVKIRKPGGMTVWQGKKEDKGKGKK